jgi:predicted AlkP superfamily phosphohydrolase/phosphomutase
VVREASRTDAHYPRDEGDELPDVLIDWARDAPVERIWSPKTGIVHRSYTHWRSGDHTEQGLLLASGPGLPQATAMPEVDMMDLGVTVAALCGVELTGELDGKPVQWLASAPAKVTG